jgi:hypothetical protein
MDGPTVDPGSNGVTNSAEPTDIQKLRATLQKAIADVNSTIEAAVAKAVAETEERLKAIPLGRKTVDSFHRNGTGSNSDKPLSLDPEQRKRDMQTGGGSIVREMGAQRAAGAASGDARLTSLAS